MARRPPVAAAPGLGGLALLIVWSLGATFAAGTAVASNAAGTAVASNASAPFAANDLPLGRYLTEGCLEGCAQELDVCLASAGDAFAETKCRLYDFECTFLCNGTAGWTCADHCLSDYGRCSLLEAVEVCAARRERCLGCCPLETPAPTAGSGSGQPTQSPTPAQTQPPSSPPTPVLTAPPTEPPPTAAPTVKPTSPPVDAAIGVPIYPESSLFASMDLPASADGVLLKLVKMVSYECKDFTSAPVLMPSTSPTRKPTLAPSGAPTTRQPTSSPTPKPSPSPTGPPSEAPSNAPSSSPTRAPVVATDPPSRSPTTEPTPVPTSAIPLPTPLPTRLPTPAPTAVPSASPSRKPTPVPITPAPTPTPGTVGYVLLSGSTHASCPLGREVSQEDCLAAANGLTPDLTTITNRDELLVNDWNGIPCDCFIWANQLIDYDYNCDNKAPNGNAQLVCLEDAAPAPSDYILLPGDQYLECPAGQEVPQEDCLAAANELTAGMTTITNRETLLVEDWTFTPCGCFVWQNQMLDFDTYCPNSVLSADAQLVCKKVPTSTTSYVLLPGSGYSQCPPGRDVPQEDCLVAANELTADLTTIVNRDNLQVYDWSFTPCGCFVWADQMLDYDPNCANAQMSASADLVCLAEEEAATQRKLVDAADYMFYGGDQYGECPDGQSVPQEECLAAANALTAGIATITNRDALLVNDWAGLPCGCFVWDNSKLDYDPNCSNQAPHPSAQLVCRHPDLITSPPTNAPTPWTPPPPVAFPAARSYDGNAWEAVHPLALQTTCDALGQCSVQLPPEECGGIHYMIEMYIADPTTPEQEAAKLLEQATFGANRELIDEFVATGSARDWIKDQMNEALTSPTLHRVHYRERSNSHVRQPIDKFGLRYPCEKGSRWNRWAFNRYRDVGKVIVLEATDIGTYVMRIDGIPRTEVDAVEFGNSLAGQNTFFNLFGTLYICRRQIVTEWDLVLANAPGDCNTANKVGHLQMPAVNFQTPVASLGLDVHVGTLEELDPPVLDVKLLSSPIDQCSFTKSWPNFIQDSTSGEYYVEDRRVRFLSIENEDINTVSGEGLATKECPTAPKTFLNEDSCVVRSDCSPPKFTSGSFLLNAENVRQFYTVGGQYIYRVVNLPIITSSVSRYEMFSPCNDAVTYKRFDWTPFRFVRKNAPLGACSSPVADSAIQSAISQLLANELASLSASERESKRVLDVVVPKGTCADPFRSALGGSFNVADAATGSTTCWTHSHPDEWSVFNFDAWTMYHPGNVEAHMGHKKNPIAAFAEAESSLLEDQVSLEMPGWHPDDRFQDSKRLFDFLGNWGDTISFDDLPASAKNDDVAAVFGAVVGSPVAVTEYRQVCSSPGEVANVPSRGHLYRLQKGGDTGEMGNDSVDQIGYSWNQKSKIWNTISTFAKDQLRQRVAWVFSSIFVVTAVDINTEHDSESWASYHDIFVRNAFGTYFDIMKEVSFHPMMGKMLTYLESKSTAYNYEKDGLTLFPDENYAREIMQLFSIGLYHLNKDGTYVMDDKTGKIAETYTNEDITTFSRAWTNFNRRAERPNLEVYSDFYAGFNNVDPMVMRTNDGRDAFPKIGLDDKGVIRGYIGDRVKRCDDMPAKAWLKRGAKYIFRGSSPNLERGRKDPESWDSWPDDSRLILDETSNSNLHSVLCNADPSTGVCRFQSTVVLGSDLDCVGQCTAGDHPDQIPVSGTLPCECSIDEPRTIRIDQPSSSNLPYAFYEYVRDECISLAIPEAGSLKAVSEIGEHWGEYSNEALCADERLAVAGTTCCDPSNTNPRNVCIFRGERTAYNTAKNRCEEIGLVTCPWSQVPISDWCGTDIQWWGDDEASGMRFSWTSEDCSIKVQINARGYVALVHEVGGLSQEVKGRVKVDVGTFFRVLWSDDAFPKVDTCASQGCTVHDTTCLCSTSVDTFAVFEGNELPSGEDAWANLHIGAVEPSAADVAYFKCTAPSCVSSSFDVYFAQEVTSDSQISQAMDANTIFELSDPVTRETMYLKNIQSIVHVGQYAFRNPPSYNSLVDQAPRDALYETDAVLWHYAKHSNTAPFVAMRLIQHLVTSNPSPRYVSVVAKAFADGTYDDFGSGKYGCLEATIAAVLLDAEARSATVEFDATSGKAREPLIKLINILRAMELGTVDGRDREVEMTFMKDKIGQESHHAPSVFSFFLTEFMPVGPAFDLGLVAPEAQLFDPPKLIGFINGVTSLTVYGLQDCEDGFGSRFPRYSTTDRPSSWVQCHEARNTTPHRLRWDPQGGAADVVSEMSLLLTGGRLSQTNEAIITQAYEEKAAQEGAERAFEYALSHLIVAPEFQVTNRVFPNESGSQLKERVVAVPELLENPPPVSGWKAIVYLYFQGGLDSFSLLMPHTCAGSTNTDFHAIRGNMAVPSNLKLPISAGSNPQPCSMFGVHPNLPFLRDLYNTGEASFVANIGTLVEPVSNSDEFEQGSKKLPPSLFAHNIQTGETQQVSTDPTQGGVLGRIGDALNLQADKEIFSAYSIAGTPKLLDGAPGVSRPADVLTEVGVKTFTPSAFEFEANMQAMNKNLAGSIFAETYSEAVSSAIGRKNLLEGAVGDLSLSPSSETCFANLEHLESPIALQFKQVARIIKQRDRLQSPRSAFYVQLGSFDAHGDNALGWTGQLLSDTNAALQCFVNDMKAEGIWNDVTIMSASEFGRTLTSNGQGTDHAWGGNHFIIGGQVAGSKIHGQYPSDFSHEGPLNIGRGRLIPTTPWEGLWNGVAEWFGVEPQNMGTVLPNIAAFDENIFGSGDLYK